MEPGLVSKDKRWSLQRQTTASLGAVVRRPEEIVSVPDGSRAKDCQRSANLAKPLIAS